MCVLSILLNIILNEFFIQNCDLFVVFSDSQQADNNNATRYNYECTPKYLVYQGLKQFRIIDDVTQRHECY